MYKQIVAVLVVAFTSTACSDSISDFGSEQLAGTYHLRSIGSDSLPVTVDSTAARRVQFTAAELLMGLNGIYREIWTFRFTQNGAITTQVDTFTGTWNFGTVVNTLTFSAVDENGTFTINATWDGVRTVSMSVDGEPWVYRK